MDNKEAMFWLAILQQANEGSKEAQEMLQQENELRTESGQPTVQEALKEKIEEAKTKDILQNGKVIWERS